MKKNILIFCTVLLVLSLTAFSVTQNNNSEVNNSGILEKENVVIKAKSNAKRNGEIYSDFIYDIGPRFNAIKKMDLDTIRSFNDIISKEHAERVVSYSWVTITLIKNDQQSNIREFGKSNLLTDAQLDFLNVLDYSTHLMIGADLEQKNKETGDLEYTSWTQYFTIVPEKQAEYSEGYDFLKQYLKNNSLEARTMAKVEAEKLKPAKLFFTVTKSGTIKNVKLDRSSNYPLVDEAMIDLIKNTPGTWQPAENSNGEKVDQELVVSFGLIGC